MGVIPDVDGEDQLVHLKGFVYRDLLVPIADRVISYSFS
jgi:hypothetical protein